MTDHYYSANPIVGSDERSWSYTLRGHSFQFTTDRGVFSKQEVDFGSRLLIEAFQFPEMEGDVLDVGCGYGPIGISLARDGGERSVHMVDVNERAIDLAKRNATANHVKNVVVYRSDLFQQVQDRQFAAIVTNPPIRAGKRVIHQLFEDARDYLLSNGELWIVIQKKQGAPSTLDKLHNLYEEVEVVTKKKGYFIIRAKRID